jgi:hypothetical protein
LGKQISTEIHRVPVQRLSSIADITEEKPQRRVTHSTASIKKQQQQEKLMEESIKAANLVKQ